MTSVPATYPVPHGAEQGVAASNVREMKVIRQDAAFPEECPRALGIRDHRREATVICLNELGPFVGDRHAFGAIGHPAGAADCRSAGCRSPVES